jgi:hypothetical protein
MAQCGLTVTVVDGEILLDGRHAMLYFLGEATEKLGPLAVELGQQAGALHVQFQALEPQKPGLDVSPTAIRRRSNRKRATPRTLEAPFPARKKSRPRPGSGGRQSPGRRQMTPRKSFHATTPFCCNCTAFINRRIATRESQPAPHRDSWCGLVRRADG